MSDCTTWPQVSPGTGPKRLQIRRGWPIKSISTSRKLVDIENVGQLPNAGHADNKMKPFLRWAGSKRKLLPLLLEAIPTNFQRYVEPFAGSACVFFAMGVKHAVLGDINDELINTYREVKRNATAVSRYISKFKRGEREYYRIRALDGSQLSSTQRAARFIYLNRFCFNGLYRTNSRGQFNVPYGAYRSGPLPTNEELNTFSTILHKVVLISGSFEKTLEQVSAGDFVYLDPPYSIQSRRVFNQYSNFSFGSEELKRLRFHLARLHKMKIPFLVSYGLSNEALELAKGYRQRRIIVQRQIAGLVKKRRNHVELVITNY